MIRVLAVEKSVRKVALSVGELALQSDARAIPEADVHAERGFGREVLDDFERFLDHLALHAVESAPQRIGEILQALQIPYRVVDIAVGVNVIIAAVLGGRRTILGAAVGAIFLIGAGEILRPLGQLATFVVSAVALVVILFFPGGFLGRLLQSGGRE